MATSSPDALVSCIVPVYNGARYLVDTLDSVLGQTYRPLELIVVDDGSTDDTPDVAASYGNRLRYVRQENRGPAAARNRGVAAARGAFVTFLDADDLWHEEKVARQHRRLAQDPAPDLCFTRFRNFWVFELKEEREAFESHPLARPISGWCIGTLMARREVFERFGSFDERLRQGENMSWFLDVQRAGGRIHILDEVLMFRRFHPGSLTRRTASDTLEGFMHVLKKWKAGEAARKAGGSAG